MYYACPLCDAPMALWRRIKHLQLTLCINPLLLSLEDVAYHSVDPVLLKPRNIQMHCKLCSITPMAPPMHVILWSFVVLTWMDDNR